MPIKHINWDNNSLDYESLTKKTGLNSPSGKILDQAMENL